MDLAQTALAALGVGLFVAWVAIGDCPEPTRRSRHRPEHRTTPRHRRPDTAHTEHRLEDR